MFGYIFSHFKPFAKIMLILFVYYCIYIYIVIKHNRSFIDKNWDQFRCKPYIIPITFLFGRPKNMNPIDGTISNANTCFWEMANKLAVPKFDFITPMLQGLISILNSLGSSMSSLKQMIGNIFKFLLKVAWDVRNRMEGMQEAMTYNFLKMYNAFKRLNSSFVMNMFMAQATVTSLTSISNSFIKGMADFASDVGIGMTYFLFGPWADMWFPKLVDPFKAVCFAGHTPILLRDGSTITIQELYKHKSLGKIVYGNGMICSVLKFDIHNTNKKLYLYNKKILVSGHHMVYENDIPVRIKDSKYSEIIYSKEDYIYCLITSHRKICIDHIWFSDFMESTDDTTNLLTYKLILQILNQSDTIIETEDDINHLYQWGLGIDTAVRMKDHSMKYIQDIEIGDTTSQGVVTGKIIHQSKPIQMYNYKNNQLSGSQAVYENGIWIRVHQSKYSTQIDYMYPEIYSITTQTNKIELKNEIIVADYFEIDEDSTDIDKIHNLNLESMTPK